jgi:class 3 adenylate cyclase
MLLGVVEANGGDTLKFCGDAVMIMWPVAREADQDLKAAAVEMASICALQLLADCGKYDRGEGVHAVSLRLHCGIGCGDVHCMCLGDQQRWEFLISGDAIHQVGRAEPEAGVGEVCLSPEAYAFVQHMLESVLMPLGNHKLTGFVRKKRRLTEEIRELSQSTSLHDIDNSCEIIDEKADFFPGVRSKPILSIPNSSSSGTSTPNRLELAERTGSQSEPPPDRKHSTDKINARYVPFVGAASISDASSSHSAPLVTSVAVEDTSRNLAAADRSADIDDDDGGLLADLCPSLFGREPYRPFPSNTSSGTLKDGHINSAESVRVKELGSTAVQTSSGSSPTKDRPMSLPKSSTVIGSFYSPDASLSASGTRTSFIDIITRRATITLPDNVPLPGMDIHQFKAALDIDHDPSVQMVRAYLTEAASVFQASPSRVRQYSEEDTARTLRRFIHDAARNAIESDTVAYLAEIRTVVTMFIEILGLDDDFNEGDFRRPQKVMAFVVACLNRFEGSLRQFVVDDKGCVMIAAFGLPGSSHEDNCTRAIETAKAIQKALETIKVSSRAGIAMGSVYCGLIGSSERCEYAMMGSSVNLAARLMSKCESGRILVNDTVYKSANEDFEFETLSPVAAKGYEQRVDVYSPTNRVQSRALGLGLRGPPTTKFVGRGEEKLMFGQDLIKFGYGDYDDERTVAHLIDGSPGIGKTSLVSEINEMAMSNANIDQIIIASASASHMSSSYFVVRQILGVIFSVRSTDLSSGRSQVKSTSSRTLSVNAFARGSYDKNFSESAPATPSSRSPQKPFDSNSVDNTDAWSIFGKKLLNMQAMSTSGGDWNVLAALDESSQYVRDIEAWMRTYASNVFVSELEPIGVFNRNPSKDPNIFASGTNSFDIIYGTGGSGPSHRFNSDSRSKSDLSKSNDGNERSLDRMTAPMSSLIPLLADVLPFKCVENEITSSLTPAMRWRMGDALIVKILQIAFKSSKTVVIVENLQWCDYQSLSVLFYLVRDTRGGLFIGTERPPEVNGLGKSRQRRRYMRMMTTFRELCTVTSLKPLFPAEVQRIMEQIVGVELVDQFPELKREDTTQQIYKRTNGVPFSVIALCLALKETLGQGRFIDINRLPSGVHNIIVNRFDQLSNTEKVVLKTASVIGNEFSMILLRDALISLDAVNCTVELYSTLLQLQEANLLRQQLEPTKRSDPHSKFSVRSVSIPVMERIAASSVLFAEEDAIFEFTDQSLRFGIYNLMLGAQQKSAHSNIGKLLERKYAQQQDRSLFPEIVHHYLFSDNISKKLMYLQLAAQQARESKDFKTLVYYNSELIRFATGLSIDGLLAYCCRVSPLRPVSPEERALTQTRAKRAASTRQAPEYLSAVHNIFAGNAGGESVATTGYVKPTDVWLELRKLLNTVVVSEEANGFGVNLERVSCWIAEIADAYAKYVHLRKF